MIGMIFVVVGTFLDEVSTSFGKWEIAHKKESMYTYGFLNYFWILVFAILLLLITGHTQFSTASIPLFILLLILEIAQTYSSLHAVVLAERSTFGFLMIGTIPLLLVVDSILGYNISVFAMIGISIIVFGLIVLLLNHGLSKKGIWYVLFSTVNATATTSIYKYMITVYNSVEMQIIFTCIILLIFLYIMARWKTKENPFLYIFKKEFFVQSVSRGIAGMIMSIAYVFAPASIIISAKRGITVLFAVISGNKVFHEKRLTVKIISFLFVVVGLIFLVK